MSTDTFETDDAETDTEQFIEAEEDVDPAAPQLRTSSSSSASASSPTGHRLGAGVRFPTLRQKTSRQRYAEVLANRESLSAARLDALVDKFLGGNILAQLLRNIPVVKLEVLDKRFWISLTCFTAFFYLVAITNATVNAILYKDREDCSLARNDSANTVSDSALEFVLYSQLAVSVLFYGVMVFLLISYPQRILVRLFRDGRFPTPEQQMLVILVIAVNVTPALNVGRLVLVWQFTCFSTDDLADFVGLYKCRNATTSVIPINSRDDCLVDMGAKNGNTTFGIASNVMNALLLATLSWTVCTILNLQGMPQDVLVDASNDLDTDLGVETIEDRFQEKRTLQAGKSFRGKAKERMEQAIRVSRLHNCACLTKMLKSCLLLTPGFSVTLSLSCVAYVIYQITVSTIFRYSISVVPIVSIVTIFRVCLDTNCLDGDGQPVGCCEEDSLGFKRAIAIAVGVGMELVLFLVLPHRFTMKTARRLRDLPYADNRSKHLGYQLFKLLASLMMLVVLICALIIVCVEPVDFWISQITLTPNAVLIEQSPLYFAGIDAYDPEFLTFIIILVCWIFALCSAYLPADSVGFTGYFVGRKRPSEKDEDSQLAREALPMLYIVTESDFLGLLILSKKAKADASEIDNRLRTLYQTRTPDLTRVLTAVVHGDLRGTMLTTDAISHSEEIVRSQLQSRVLCMETCLLLFNFANASYYVQVGDTLEDNGRFIEDKKFRLLDVISDEDTDTCVLLAKSADRMVVAFRGTVSSKNVKTDLNYELCPHKEAEKIKETFAGGKYASVEAQVHSGFMEAYESVRERVIEHIARERGKSPNMPVLCCGHSLGGGLAALAAFDLSTTQGVRVVNCTTFGCPKVGNAVFKEIYNSVIPSHFRFTLIRDVIPALTKPFSMFVYRHLGTEIVLDLEGKLVISPNIVERYLMLNIRRYDQHYHFMSRYALALLTWIARAHGDVWKPPTWLAVNNGVTKHCRVYLDSLNRRDRKLAGNLRKLILSDGVEFTKDKVLFRDSATQTNIVLPPGLDIDEGAILALSEAKATATDLNMV